MVSEVLSGSEDNQHYRYSSDHGEFCLKVLFLELYLLALGKRPLRLLQPPLSANQNQTKLQELGQCQLLA